MFIKSDKVYFFHVRKSNHTLLLPWQMFSYMLNMKMQASADSYLGNMLCESILSFNNTSMHKLLFTENIFKEFKKLLKIKMPTSARNFMKILQCLSRAGLTADESVKFFLITKSHFDGIISADKNAKQPQSRNVFILSMV